MRRSLCAVSRASLIYKAYTALLIDFDTTSLGAYWLKKNKKLVKKLAKKYDAFLVSKALIKQIPRLLRSALSKVSKSRQPADFISKAMQSMLTAICEYTPLTTLLGKRRAHRRAPPRSRRGLAAPRVAAVGASASLHEVRVPARHPHESGTAAAAERRRRALPCAMGAAHAVAKHDADDGFVEPVARRLTALRVVRYCPQVRDTYDPAAASSSPAYIHEDDSSGRALADAIWAMWEATAATMRDVSRIVADVGNAAGSAEPENPFSGLLRTLVCIGEACSSCQQSCTFLSSSRDDSTRLADEPLPPTYSEGNPWPYTRRDRTRSLQNQLAQRREALLDAPHARKSALCTARQAIRATADADRPGRKAMPAQALFDFARVPAPSAMVYVSVEGEIIAELYVQASPTGSAYTPN
ncbi:hypothetical protein EV715DRAFT_286866 [Schizophyllum commune]